MLPPLIFSRIHPFSGVSRQSCLCRPASDIIKPLLVHHHGAEEGKGGEGVCERAGGHGAQVSEAAEVGLLKSFSLLTHHKIKN